MRKSYHSIVVPMALAVATALTEGPSGLIGPHSTERPGQAEGTLPRRVVLSNDYGLKLMTTGALGLVVTPLALTLKRVTRGSVVSVVVKPGPPGFPTPGPGFIPNPVK